MKYFAVGADQGVRPISDPWVRPQTALEADT